jgi:large subunit ribosomal protein L22
MKMGNNYTSKDYDKENMARAIGRALPISFKHSLEICNFVRNKNVKYAKDFLNEVINEGQAVPFKRFNSDVGHKKNMAAGRYPKKASTEILNLISHVEANAQFKGLNTANLKITHINANKASKVTHFGRKRSRESKRTSVEIVVQEKSDKKPAKKEVKEPKQVEKVEKPKVEVEPKK